MFIEPLHISRGDSHNQSNKLPRKALFSKTANVSNLRINFHLTLIRKENTLSILLDEKGKNFDYYSTNFDGNLFSEDFAGVTLRCWMRREIALARESLLIAACCADP